MAHHQKEFLVREALEKAIAKYGVPQEILTDNGRQYGVWRGKTRFEEELRRQGIQHVKSRPQHPQTLGKAERYGVRVQLGKGAPQTISMEEIGLLTGPVLRRLGQLESVR